MAPQPLITLCTDFGTADSYLAQMKGVLLSSLPGAQLIDITHEVPFADIYRGAQILKEAAKTFPEHTIHIGVVDPGVGSARRRIVLYGAPVGSSKEQYFVGPDNGLFSLALDFSSVRAWEITPEKQQSATFDGRDVFSPVAAQIASGNNWQAGCREIAASGLVSLSSPQVVLHGKNIKGEVTVIDSFGNAATNISAADLQAALCDYEITCGSRLALAVSSFFEVPEGTLGALLNSQGNLEFVCNKARADKEFGLQLGDSVKLSAK